MDYEWLITNAKYSILRHLYVRPFNAWQWAIDNPDGEEAAEKHSQFHLFYPTGNFSRPSIAIEVPAGLAGSKPGSEGYFNESYSFSLFVLDADGSAVERNIQRIKQRLQERVGWWEWNERRKIFEAALTQSFEVVYRQFQLPSKRQLKDKPEAVITMSAAL